MKKWIRKPNICVVQGKNRKLEHTLFVALGITAEKGSVAQNDKIPLMMAKSKICERHLTVIVYV